MSLRLGHALLISAVLALTSTVAVAQAIPSPAQAQQMLQSNPQLIQRLQQMMMSSGMTPEQIRARLRSQGYPESLLDQYLPGSQTRPDSTTVPSEDIFAAVRSLGFADSLALDSLTTQSRGRRRPRNQADPAFA